MGFPTETFLLYQIVIRLRTLQKNTYAPMEYKLPKGTFDIVPKPLKDENSWKSSYKWQYLEEIFKSLANTYHFLEIRTPIFESTDLFVRSCGEETDIASKEMYTFEDRGNRSISLRPEGTAPIMRAFGENKLQLTAPFHKYYYFGPYFRYDRPQAGRFRQFHQLGVESIGEDSPERDYEILEFIYQFYQKLNLRDIKIIINSLGTDTKDSQSTKARYIVALKAYLKPHFESLSDDSQKRFEHNPLRILDTKNEKERELLKGAPSILDYLDEAAKQEFDTLCAYLTTNNIPFEISPMLVRGLDYYEKTVFEITSSTLGAQNSIGGGGRFNSLLKKISGIDLPAVGFAAGMERILLTMEKQHAPFPEPHGPFVFFIPLGDKEKKVCLSMLSSMRAASIPSEIYSTGKKIQKAMQIANDIGASYVCILGSNEMEKGKVTLKNLSSRSEETINQSELLQTMQNYWESEK